MLILTRNVGNSIIIGDTVKVVVLSAKGMQIKLGIEAPREISVHREEIYKKIKIERMEQKALEKEETFGNK